jgi:hypothetical protein
LNEFVDWLNAEGELRDWLKTHESLRILKQRTGFYWPSARDTEDKSVEMCLSQESAQVCLSQGSAASLSLSDIEFMRLVEDEDNWNPVDELEKAHANAQVEDEDQENIQVGDEDEDEPLRKRTKRDLKPCLSQENTQVEAEKDEHQKI